MSLFSFQSSVPSPPSCSSTFPTKPDLQPAPAEPQSPNQLSGSSEAPPRFCSSSRIYLAACCTPPFPSVQSLGGLGLLCRPRESGSRSTAFPTTLLVYHCLPDPREGLFQALHKLAPLSNHSVGRGIVGGGCGVGHVAVLQLTQGSPCISSSAA